MKKNKNILENELALSTFGSIVTSCAMLSKTDDQTTKRYWRNLKKSKSLLKEYNTIYKITEKIVSDFDIPEEEKEKLVLLTDLRNLKTPLVAVMDNNVVLPLFRNGNEAGLVKDYNDMVRAFLRGDQVEEKCQAEWIFVGVEDED